MKKYDALYIFTGAAKEEALQPMIEKAIGEITRLGGNPIGTEMLGKRQFARTLHKQESGHYVRVRFECDSAQLDALRARYHLMDEVFRVEILAVDERRERLVAEQTARRKARAEAAAAAAEAALEAHGEETRNEAAEVSAG